MAFGGEGQAPAVEVDFDGGKFKLVGKIDRVDVNGGRFIVIDYKSGASAAHFTEKDLYIGHKMQLPVYVKAVEDSFNLRPAGFIILICMIILRIIPAKTFTFITAER